MRRYDIDNLRWMCILLLFPFHTFTLYNNWGEIYYVHGAQSPVLSLLVRFCQPWFMPLMFVIAGISAVYSLNRRTPRQYLKERVTKLLIPLLAGILLVVPSLTYFAERFHNGYTGGYFAQYKLFFSKSDLVGYHGGFTPAHLWFLAYLFVVSLLALPLVCRWKPGCRKILWPLPGMAALFLPVWLFSYVLNINGKSLGRYFMLFLLGATVLSRDEVQQKLESARWKLLTLWTVVSALSLFVHMDGIFRDGFLHLAGWSGILALFGLARRYLNFHNRITAYFTKASFVIYIFHLPFIVAAAYYTFPRLTSVWGQLAVILPSSFLLALAAYGTVRRIPALRFLFAVKR